MDSTFSAAGIPSAPIVFTSIRDDSYGGDTSGDGTFAGVNNNITGDPLFKLNDPYDHLVSCSPAVDTGDPADSYA